MSKNLPTRGRPTLYTPELAQGILERIAAGESLRAICSAEGMPDESTVRLWAVQDRDGFSTPYAQACEVRAMKWAEEIVEISDDRDGDPQRDRLRVDTRKWIASKLLPRVFGEKVEHTGRDGGPVEVTVTHRVVDARSSD